MWWLVTSGMMVTTVHAGKPRVVTVVVQDVEGAPIPNAWVRVPGAERTRSVEPDTGVWEAAFVYGGDGSPRIFEKGMELALTVTAPGYRPRRLVYRVKGRNNRIDVTLELFENFTTIDGRAETIDTLMQQWLSPPAREEEEEEGN